MALTVVNIAKAEHWLSKDKETRGAFSMADIKTMYNNSLMFEKFYSVFAKTGNRTINENEIRKLLYYGCIAS